MKSENAMDADDPISYQIDDELGRGAFVENLAVALRGGNAGIRVLALTGEWGAGKTSIINMLKRRLQDSGLNIIDFCPWQFTGKEDLMNPFAREFARRIDSFIAQKCSVFENEADIRHWKRERKRIMESAALYSKEFVPIDMICNDVFSSLSASGNILLGIFAPIAKYLFGLAIKHTATSLAEQKEIINRFFIDNGIHNLIIIDDIDRLTPKETLQIFRIVRENADFANTVYLLAFDKGVVIKMLESKGIAEANGFIEKIVNVEYPIPYPEPYRIKEYIRRCLWQVANVYGEGEMIKTEAAKYRFENIIDAISDLLPTVRHIKRYINMLLLCRNLVYADNALDVNFLDFIAFEYIREKYPRCYQAISKNEGLLTEENKSNIGEDERKTLDAIYDGDEKLKRLLQILFPIAYSASIPWDTGLEEEWRIYKKNAFNIYFQLTATPDSNKYIILPEVRDFIRQQGSKQGMLDYLRNIKESKLSLFLNILSARCTEMDFIDKNNAALFAAAIFDFSLDGGYASVCYNIAEKYLDVFAASFFRGKNTILADLIKAADNFGLLTMYIAKAVDVFVANNRIINGEDGTKQRVEDTIYSCIGKVKSNSGRAERQDYNNVLLLMTNLYYISGKNAFLERLSNIMGEEIAVIVNDVFASAINQYKGYFIGNNFVYDNDAVIKRHYDSMEALLEKGNIGVFDSGVIKALFLHIKQGQMTDSRGVVTDASYAATMSFMIKKYGDIWSVLREYLQSLLN